MYLSSLSYQQHNTINYNDKSMHADKKYANLFFFLANSIHCFIQFRMKRNFQQDSQLYCYYYCSGRFLQLDLQKSLSMHLIRQLAFVNWFVFTQSWRQRPCSALVTLLHFRTHPVAFNYKIEKRVEQVHLGCNWNHPEVLQKKLPEQHRRRNRC